MAKIVTDTLGTSDVGRSEGSARGPRHGGSASHEPARFHHRAGPHQPGEHGERARHAARSRGDALPSRLDRPDAFADRHRRLLPDALPLRRAQGQSRTGVLPAPSTARNTPASPPTPRRRSNRCPGAAAFGLRHPDHQHRRRRAGRRIRDGHELLARLVERLAEQGQLFAQICRPTSPRRRKRWSRRRRTSLPGARGPARPGPPGAAGGPIGAVRAAAGRTGRQAGGAGLLGEVLPESTEPHGKFPGSVQWALARQRHRDRRSGGRRLGGVADVRRKNLEGVRRRVRRGGAAVRRAGRADRRDDRDRKQRRSRRRGGRSRRSTT